MLTRALVCPTLVGRDEELAQLVERRLAASRGHGSLVLIAGDAGIGKSRLLVAFRQTVTGGRAALGVGLNREFGNPPYGAVLEAFRALKLDTSLSHKQTRAEQQADLVERLARGCSRRCAVLLLEDIHWADDGTLLFLQHLVPRLAALRVLAIATYRTDDVQRLELLQPQLARLVRNRSTHSIALKPLAPPDVRRLLRLALGQTRRLPGATLEEIVERSDGNPFFAEELLKNALDSASARSGQLPMTVRATVLERVAGLDTPTQEILSRAAVLGRRFDAAFLSELCAVDSARMLAVLRKLRNLQLIDELDSDAPAYAFRHALTQEAIYSEMLAAERKPLHSRILSALEARDADAGALGYHAWAAGNAEKCVLYNERAGDRAQATHVYGEAIRCYDRALAFADDQSARARLFAKSAQAWASDGKPMQAIERYESAAQLLRSLGATTALTDVYTAMSAQARAGGDNERGVQILESVLDTLPQLEGTQRESIALSLTYLRLDRGEVSAARTLLAQCSALVGTPQYQNAVQYAELVAGDVQAFREAARVNTVLHESAGEIERLRHRFNVGFGFTVLGCDDEALAVFDELLPQVRDARLASFEILSCANAALVHTRAGRLSQARALIGRAAAIPEPTTTGPIALAAAALTAGYALWDEELVARLCSSEIVESAFASRINSTLGRIAGPYARWLWALGHVEEAQDILQRAVRQLTGPFGATETLLAAAELGTESTRLAAFEYLPILDGMSNAEVYAAAAHHLRALRASHQGDRAATQMHARDAITQYVRLGWTMHQAACMHLAGDVKRASLAYRRMQAAGPLRQIRAHAGDAPAATALSEREREIAALVARGTVNKHIAERLSVNQRTVEKHLTSIYEKLGLRNRSELAAYVTRTEPR